MGGMMVFMTSGPIHAPIESTHVTVTDGAALVFTWDADARIEVQGVLEGRAESGTMWPSLGSGCGWVRSAAREQPDGSPFRADMKAVGRNGGWESRTDAKVPAPAEIAARLGIGEGELCVRTVYEFLADGRPVQLSTSWEPYDLTGGTLVVLPEGGPHAAAGVVNRMAEIGVTVGHAVEQPEPRQATAEEASLLGIQKAALVTHIRRTYYSDQGRPVETADVVVPVALCEIVYEVPISRS